MPFVKEYALSKSTKRFQLCSLAVFLINTFSWVRKNFTNSGESSGPLQVIWPQIKIKHLNLCQGKHLSNLIGLILICYFCRV